MTHLTLRYFSDTLTTPVEATILAPKRMAEPAPVLYLLHGLLDDQTTWLRRTRLEVYADALPFVIVIPNGGRSFYVDHAAGSAWGTAIASELPIRVEELFNLRTDRAGRFIAGLSMGGYGAFRIALAHPDRYIAAASHSGALMSGSINVHTRVTTLPEEEARRIFGDDPRGTGRDLIHLAETTDAASLPQLYFDCGHDDFLFEDNRTFASELARRHVPHTFDQHPGGHSWDYWDRHIQTTLTRFSRLLA